MIDLYSTIAIIRTRRVPKRMRLQHTQKLLLTLWFVAAIGLLLTTGRKKLPTLKLAPPIGYDNVKLGHR